VLSSFIFGAIGGMLAIGLNSDFFAWIQNSIKRTTPTAKETLIKEKIITSLVDEEAATIGAVNKVLSSTVNIVISKDLSKYYNQTGSLYPFEYFYDYGNGQGPKKTEIGGGSGFIISSDGLILTNRHVVSDATADYTVILSDGKKYDAKILSTDAFLDIAFLKIEAKNLPIVTIGDSDKIVAGQTVIAIGYTLSEYQNTVTKGIVSGVKRRVSAQGETIDEAIQTDAAINPGNSGGPLINLRGEVIGVNAAINKQGQLIGFAIPINSAKQLIDSVKKYGKIVRPWLGVRYILLSKEISEANNFSVDYGALLLRGTYATDLAVIPGSPADKAGLKENDIILEVSGIRVDENSSLSKLLAKYNIGQTVTLKVLRQGKEMSFKVVLEEYGKK
jgi:serine protease Do